MDKQKQVEKIANTIDDYLEGIIVGNEQTLAKMIYEKILPEDSVVLTKEEWENYKSSFRNQLYCKDIQYGIEIKELRNDRDYWREEYRQARKETAREFAKGIIKMLWNRSRDAHGKIFEYGDLTSIEVWELAKQHGVDIEE